MQDIPSAIQPDTTQDRKRPLWLRLLPLAVLAAVLGIAMYAGAGKYLSFEYFVKSRESLAAYTKSHLALSLLAYFAVYAAAVSVAVPGALFLTIAGGFLFGGWLGACVTVVAATLGASILFLIARTSLGETLAQRSGPWIDRLRRGFREDAASYMLFLRLVPVFPFWLINLASAIIGIPLRTFIWTTFLGIIPATLAYSLAGAGLDSVVVAQKQAYELCLSTGAADCRFNLSPKSLVTRELVLGFAAIGLAALLPVVLKKWKRRSQAGTGSPP